MTSTSHDVNGNDVKNGNDVGVKNGNPTVIKHAVPETGSMKILNYRQSAILKLKENNACNNCIHDLAC